MNWSLLAMLAPRTAWQRRTVRLRLTIWYSGLFLISGSALLILTYSLVAQAVSGDPGATAACLRPGLQCHFISSQQARTVALHEHAALLGELWSRSALGLGIMTMLSIALGWFIAGRALRPLRAITTAARQISAASLSERLALTGPDDELKELADTFDRLLARLEASFSAQRQFIANAAHEMRAPLARQRIISQVALADPAASVESLRAAHQRVMVAGSEQQHIIDALLVLARGQAGLDKREPFDLCAITSQVLLSRRSEASDRGIEVHDVLGPALAAGNPGLTERLVSNLVDNALRHNMPGGRVDVSTRTDDGRAVLSVANTGPPVPAAALDLLFKPFQRMTAERTSHNEGLGLGLSIVQAIAQAHDACITARPLPEGGLLMEVAFADARIANRAPLNRSGPPPSLQARAG